MSGLDRALAMQKRGLVERIVPTLPGLARKITSTIQGMGVPQQAGTTLYLMARFGPGQGHVVEIGSGFGRSTCFLAAGSKAANRGAVWTVDPHTGDPWYLKQQGLKSINSCSIFTKNIRKLGFQDWVRPLVMTSEEASQKWAEKGKPIRLLFIDGLHTYEAVRLDIKCWLPFVVSGGLVVFDDCGHPRYPGVKKAVDEVFSDLHHFGDLTWTFKQ